VQVSPNTPEAEAICRNCGDVQRFVLKSHIYDFYRFAFKFVNREPLPYPLYFERTEKLLKSDLWIEPIGEIKDDWGPLINDFAYDDQSFDERFRRDPTDPGTSRAFGVLIEPAAEPSSKIEGACLTHETGLEVFLIATAAFVGTEVAKYSIKRTLESIEGSINKWYRKTNKKGTWQLKDSETPLVEKILVRTPYWEISLDGRFTMEERLRILDHIGQNMLPQESITEYLSSIEGNELTQKTIEATRSVIRRF
jgi:hypothetical protein